MSLTRRPIIAAAAAAASVLLGGCLQLLPALAPSAKDVEPGISAEFPYERRFVEVSGSRMAYVEAGEGDPILLVHGNPTSSYLWRNVIPHLENSGRVIAVDLIGMGASDKPDIPYRFEDHAAYLSGFIEAMALENVTLVLHDWGGALGLDYAARNPGNVRAVALMETVTMPMPWSDASLPERYLFGRLRDPEGGFELAAERNYFIERMLPMMAGRDLSEQEMAAYRAPFPTPQSRLPVAQWPVELPLGGEPADNVTRIQDNYDWLRSAETPLLLVRAEPGVIMKPAMLERLRADLPRMEEAFVGSGFHYIQETQPTRIGNELAAWLERLDAQG